MSVLTLSESPKSNRQPAPERKTKDRWLDDPDVLLMLRVQSGDEDAFRQLVGGYHARIFGFFCHHLGDRQDAEDLTQDVLLRLFRARHSYRPRARFSTWVFHIARNVARNAVRFRQRHPSVSFSMAKDDEHALEALTSNVTDMPSAPIERAELASAVRAAIATLGERQRAALELHQFHDRTYAEVAAQLDMTPKAAKSLLYRTRNLLRARLMPLFFND